MAEQGGGKKNNREIVFLLCGLFALSVAALRPSIRFCVELVRLLGYFIIDRL
jgi:hypothetical protein